MQVPTRVNPTEIDPKYQSRVKREGKTVKIDATDIYFKDLNAILRAVIQQTGLERIEIHNVCGQRYIGTDLNTNIQIHIYGTPGNDLAASTTAHKSPYTATDKTAAATP
jgi:hypothetical protein